MSQRFSKFHSSVPEILRESSTPTFFLRMTRALSLLAFAAVGARRAARDGNEKGLKSFIEFWTGKAVVEQNRTKAKTICLS